MNRRDKLEEEYFRNFPRRFRKKHLSDESYDYHDIFVAGFNALMREAKKLSFNSNTLSPSDLLTEGIILIRLSDLENLLKDLPAPRANRKVKTTKRA